MSGLFYFRRVVHSLVSLWASAFGAVTLVADLEALLRSFGNLLSSSFGSAVFAAEAEMRRTNTMPDQAKLFAAQCLSQVEAIFTRAKERGEIGSGFDVEAGVGMIAGGVLFRWLAQGGASDEIWIKHLIEVVIAAARR